MKTKIKEVHDYFRNKMIEGNFEIKQIGSFVVLILIDKKYSFNIWIANDGLNISCYDDGFNCNFMLINFRRKDKEKLFRKLKKPISIYKKELNIQD